MRVNKDTLKAMFAPDIPFECIYKTTWWLYDESYIPKNIEVGAVTYSISQSMLQYGRERDNNQWPRSRGFGTERQVGNLQYWSNQA